MCNLHMRRKELLRFATYNYISSQFTYLDAGWMGNLVAKLSNESDRHFR
jgi:deoxycytidine triphosphate deaminase